MDYETAQTFMALLVGLSLVSLGRGRYALEGQYRHAWAYVETVREARQLLRG